MDTAIYKYKNGIPLKLDNNNNQQDKQDKQEQEQEQHDIDHVAKVLNFPSIDFTELDYKNSKCLHDGYYCDGCYGSIAGIRHYCKNCISFDFCEKCFAEKLEDHSKNHKLVPFNGSRWLCSYVNHSLLEENRENMTTFVCENCNLNFCNSCYENNTHTNEHTFESIQPPKTLKGYHYKICSASVISEKKFVYVLMEDKNFGGNIDIHYYLKAYDDGIIVADWELESYNPYFGCTIHYLKWNDKISLEYFGKHSLYNVIIIPVDADKGWTNYLGSKPQKFRRDKEKDIYETIEIIKQ